MLNKHFLNEIFFHFSQKKKKKTQHYYSTCMSIPYRIIKQEVNFLQEKVIGGKSLVGRD